MDVILSHICPDVKTEEILPANHFEYISADLNRPRLPPDKAPFLNFAMWDIRW